MTEGIGHAAGSTRAASPSGTIRGSALGSPPPVTWAIPWTSAPDDLAAARIARTVRA